LVQSLTYTIKRKVKFGNLIRWLSAIARNSELNFILKEIIQFALNTDMPLTATFNNWHYKKILILGNEILSDSFATFSRQRKVNLCCYKANCRTSNNLLLEDTAS